MVKLFFFCKRRSDIDQETYQKALLDGHVPIALRHHPTMRRYVVNIVDVSPSNEPPYDSIGELSFDSLADYRERLYDSPHGRQIVHNDVVRFMGSATAYATTEHVHRAGERRVALGVRSPGVKMIAPIRRRRNLSHEAFLEHWLQRHAPLALQHHPGLQRYVANVVDQCLSDGGAALDGIAELTFTSAKAVQSEMFTDAEAERAIREDMAHFIEHTTGYLTSEYVQKVPNDE